MWDSPDFATNLAINLAIVPQESLSGAWVEIATKPFMIDESWLVAWQK
jgi:hypothetical protein